MKTTYYVIIGILAAAFVLWNVWGYFSARVEQARYTVIKKTSDYEIRHYAAHIEAQTTVSGSYDQALNEGFRIIAGYIFGGNVKKEPIAMTAPVTERSSASEPIAMTAPVVAELGEGERTIAFVMPSSYTPETLPTPNDSRVQIVEVPARAVAALSFSWYRSAGRVAAMEKTLLDALAHDQIQTTGAPTYAGYNAPWTPPWMLRNEILIQVEQ